MTWKPGSHASTFGGNPVACAAALETIALLEEELMENATKVGAALTTGLEELKSRHPLIGDVRGKGLLLAIELVRDRATKEPAPEECEALVQTCYHKGLLLLRCGETSVRLSPPLVIDQKQAETAVTIIDESLAEVARGGGVRTYERTWRNAERKSPKHDSVSPKH